MITVERTRLLAAPADQIQAVLADPTQISRLMPRAERVDVLGQNENRARVAIIMRLGRLGTQRIEGEARVLPDGVRFIAVQPMEIDARWRVQGRDTGTEVTARLNVDVPRAFQSILRLIPQRLIQQHIGKELDQALDALEASVEQSPTPQARGTA